MQKIKYIVLLLCIVLFTQCEVEYTDFESSAGEADFTTFIAVGDSYTAGYTDGALGERGQLNGFSYILSEQLNNVGSSSFVQPLVTSGGSIGSAGNGYYELQIVDETITPVATDGDATIFADRLYDGSAPIQNLGVPGAKSSHLLATVASTDPLQYYSEVNLYFGRFASTETTSIIADAVALDPTFISLWIGGNDVLTYALAGGESDEVTSAEMFETYLGLIATNLFSNGAKGAIANVPDIDVLPYFNYILSDGHIAFIIEDDEDGGIRVLVEGEKVLLSASSLIASGYGLSEDMPLGAEYILDLDEVEAIQTATEAYNETIKEVATQYDLAHVDLNALMDEASDTGVVVDGVTYTSTFVSGGTFSLDGIHATGRGNAIIANTFIDAINTQYNANIPLAVVNDYDGVVYP